MEPSFGKLELPSPPPHLPTRLTGGNRSQGNDLSRQPFPAIYTPLPISRSRGYGPRPATLS